MTEQGGKADSHTAASGTRPSLSVVIITLNEERKLRECLESVKWADEIIVMDSHSGDRTAEIARQYTQKVYQHDFTGDGPMRNLGIDKAVGQWILTIDADERVTPELRQEIESTLLDPKASAYYIPRKAHFLGRWMKHCGWWPNYVLRLFRKDCGRYDEHLAHAKVVTKDKTGKLRSPFLHYPYDTLSEYIAKINSHTSLIARQKMRAKTVFGCFVWATGKFFRTYLLQLGFLDGEEGLILSILASHYAFLKHTKIWEASRRKR